jgi:hypothetical protein
MGAKDQEIIILQRTKHEGQPLGLDRQGAPHQHQQPNRCADPQSLSGPYGHRMHRRSLAARAGVVVVGVGWGVGVLANPRRGSR